MTTAIKLPNKLPRNLRQLGKFAASFGVSIVRFDLPVIPKAWLTYKALVRVMEMLDCKYIEGPPDYRFKLNGEWVSAGGTFERRGNGKGLIKARPSVHILTHEIAHAIVYYLWQRDYLSTAEDEFYACMLTVSVNGYSTFDVKYAHMQGCSKALVESKISVCVEAYKFYHMLLEAAQENL